MSAGCNTPLATTSDLTALVIRALGLLVGRMIREEGVVDGQRGVDQPFQWQGVL